MAYTKIGGVAFTGQEPEVASRENRVALTQGERAKMTSEEPWERAVILEKCGATGDGNNSCYYPAGHTRKEHSWHSSTDSA